LAGFRRSIGLSKTHGGLLPLDGCVFILFITGDLVLFKFGKIPSKQKRPLRALYPLKGTQVQGAFKTQSKNESA
jgi:hypothetical protein